MRCESRGLHVILCAVSRQGAGPAARAGGGRGAEEHPDGVVEVVAAAAITGHRGGAADDVPGGGVAGAQGGVERRRPDQPATGCLEAEPTGACRRPPADRDDAELAVVMTVVVEPAEADEIGRCGRAPVDPMYDVVSLGVGAGDTAPRRKPSTVPAVSTSETPPPGSRINAALH